MLRKSCGVSQQKPQTKTCEYALGFEEDTFQHDSYEETTSKSIYESRISSQLRSKEVVPDAKLYRRSRRAEL